MADKDYSEKYPKYFVYLCMAYVGILAMTFTILPPTFYGTDDALFLLLPLALPAMVFVLYFFEIIKFLKAMRIVFIIAVADALFFGAILTYSFF